VVGVALCEPQRLDLASVGHVMQRHLRAIGSRGRIELYSRITMYRSPQECLAEGVAKEPRPTTGQIIERANWAFDAVDVRARARLIVAATNRTIQQIIVRSSIENSLFNDSSTVFEGIERVRDCLERYFDRRVRCGSSRGSSTTTALHSLA